jgi:hypothetical protein
LRRHRTENGAERVEQKINISIGVRGRQRHAQARGTGRDGGRSYRGYQHTSGAEQIRRVDSSAFLTAYERNDRRRVSRADAINVVAQLRNEHVAFR